MAGESQLDTTALKEQLLARKQEIETLSSLTADASRPVELDQQRLGRLSRIDALQSQEMAKETERRRTVELQRIAAALKRMDDGEYGYCVSCDKRIPLKRLEQDPATPLCVDCAGRQRSR